jgi:hypothetical protein
MSRTEWRAMPPPGPIPPHATATCSDDPDPKGLALTGAEPSQGAVVCGYVDAYGARRLPVTFSFDGAYRLNSLRFWFEDGRLARIGASVSLDGYDALVGDFTRRYGPSQSLVRDTVRTEIGPLPRVVQTWAIPSGSIVIVDPAMPENLIRVTLSAKALQPGSNRPKIARR